MSAEGSASKIGVEALFELSGTDREAKAYAFLYAAFKRTEISLNPVRDALDCLTPFIAPYLNTIATKQVLVEGIKQNLQADFGFDIPLYAIEHLMPALQKAGYVEYNKTVGRYFAKRQDNKFEFAKNEIEIQFDEVTTELTSFAKLAGYVTDPPSGGWGEALITFLKTRTERKNVSVVVIKGALIDPGKAESAIVGGFIRNLHTRNPTLFTMLLNIFMGVLVEDFISSVSEIGDVKLERPVHVLYDTTVLLRLLGCSGRLLKVATEELTVYLQDLGFKLYYFAGNETEVAGIFETLIYVKDTGREIEGETAEAIASGDVTMTEIRMLQNTFTERLATFNVFPADQLEGNVVDNSAHQIDERGFSEYLKQQALAHRRNYGQQNRDNDSRYLASIMRMRRRITTRDLASCGYIFVTSNKFLSQRSRRYLIDQRIIQPQHCPPILSLGQITTIAWLMKDKALAPEKAGRELLSNCFAAVRPDHDWFRYFREGIEKVTGSVEEFVKDPKKGLTLQAARRIAQEESFGNSAVVRELNMAEILKRAEDQYVQFASEKETQAAAEREAAAFEFDRFRREAEASRILETQTAIAERNAAVQAATEATAKDAQSRFEAQIRSSAYRKADRVLNTLKMGLFVLFVAAALPSVVYEVRGERSETFWGITIFLFLVNVFDIMDLMKIRLAERIISPLRNWIAGLFMA